MAGRKRRPITRTEEAVIDAVGDRVIAELSEKLDALMEVIDDLSVEVEDQRGRIAVLEAALGLEGVECTCPACRPPGLTN